MKPKAASPVAHRWQPARTASAIVAAAALTLPAAACTSGHASSGSSSHAGANVTSAVGYSRCMRSHGVPSFPDPGSSGVLPKVSVQRLGVSSLQLQAARRACQHLLPGNGGALTASSLRQCELTSDCPAALVQQALNEGRRFAQCMRSHGVPNWPDPTTDSAGRPYFDLSAQGFSRQQAHSPQIRARVSECEHVMPSGLPQG